MRNWLIKLLGGYTKKEYDHNDTAHRMAFRERTNEHFLKQAILEIKLENAQKNDHRDSKGRFTKGTK